MDEDKTIEDKFVEEFTPTYGTECPGYFIHEYLTKYKVASIYEIYAAYRNFKREVSIRIPTYYSFTQNYIFRLRKLGKIEYVKDEYNLTNLRLIKLYNPETGKYICSGYDLWRKSCVIVYIHPKEILEYINNLEKDGKVVVKTNPYFKQFKTKYIKIVEGQETLDDIWKDPQKAYKELILGQVVKNIGGSGEQ